MDALIVQIGHRHGRISEFFKSTGDTVTAGRGFSNDIILADPHVAPDQVKFRYVDDVWVMDVVDETNPVLINGSPVSGDNIRIHSGDKIILGRTNLTVFAESHRVDKTRRIFLENWIHHARITAIYPLLAVLLAIGFELLSDYQQYATTIKYDKLLYDSLIMVFMLFVWAGGWALIGRLLRHQPYFMAQLFFVALIFSLSSISEPLATYMEYISSSASVGDILQWGLTLLFFVALIKYNLSLSTNLTNSTLVAFLVSVSLLIFTYSLVSLQKDSFNTYPVYSRTMKPPFARMLSHNDSIDVYMASVEHQFDRLEDELNDESAQ